MIDYPISQSRAEIKLPAYVSTPGFFLSIYCAAFYRAALRRWDIASGIDGHRVWVEF